MACDTPYFIKLNRPKYINGQPIYSVNVACGKCYPCIRRRVNQWAFRLLQEDKRSVSSYFITLTYDTEHVPLTSKCNMTLCKKDLQKFFKRLRYYHDTDGIYPSEIKEHRIERLSIRYYACGEYGGLFGRPHYHSIIFNCFPDAFHKAWTFGNIQFREADRASIFYTLKYMVEKESTKWSYDEEIVKEFALRSKGLGDNYITSGSLSHHTSNLDNNYVMSRSYKVALPRYYARKFWPDGERSIDGNSNPHPHRIALLAHIKKAVNDTTDKQRSNDERNGLHPDSMNLIRKKARQGKLKGPTIRGF